MSNQPQLISYIKEKLKNTNFFSCSINQHKLIACFGNETYGELTSFMFKRYQADVALVIDLKTKNIKATRSAQSDFKLDVFMKTLCEGTSKDNVGAGVLTEKFMQFSKKFQPCTAN